MEAPPERPIVSASGSIMEMSSQFVNHHIKEYGIQHPSYLEDTPDFLCHVDLLNEQGKLPENALVATLYVEGLFTNIPHKEGLDKPASTQM